MEDKSGNSRDATHQFGQPVFSSNGGPGGMPALEFRRSGGNDALSIGGSAFFAKDQFYVFRSLGATFDFFGGILGHTPPIQIQGVLIIFENRRTYFHRNQYPSAVFKNGISLNEPYDLYPIDEFMILRLQVNDGNTGPHTDYRIGTIAENSNYSSSIRVSEIIAYDSVLSASNAQVVEDYLKKKWGVENILDSSTLSNHGTGTPHHSTAKFGTGINFDGLTYGKSISSRISTLQVVGCHWQFGSILKVRISLFSIPTVCPFLPRSVCKSNDRYLPCLDWIKPPRSWAILMNSGPADTFH